MKNFIKWLISKTEGYSLIEKDDYSIIDYGEDRITMKEFLSGKSMAFSLLLQRAIEGVNKENNFLIYQDHDEIRIEHNEDFDFNEIFPFRHQTVDEAKFAALKFIWGKE